LGIELRTEEGVAVRNLVEVLVVFKEGKRIQANAQLPGLCIQGKSTKRLVSDFDFFG